MHGFLDWSWFRSTPFRSPLQGGFKGLEARGRRGRRSEDRRGLHLRKASRELQRGLKGLEGASRGLERGDKKGFTFGRLQGGLKGASRGVHLRKGGLEAGSKGASRGLQDEGEEGFEKLEGGLKGA